MIHLVTAANRHLYRDQVRELHRERRRQFIEERGWALQERDGGEYDAYDDDLAVHLVGFSASGAIEVGCRLRPTATGGVIPDVFPHLVAASEPPPGRPGTFECTRYFCTPVIRGRAGFEARSKLHLAMVEFMRDVGGDRLLGFVDLPLLTHLRRFSGLRIRPVGLPAGYAEGGVTVAFEIGVAEADLHDTRRRLRIATRQLFAAPAWLPDGTDVLALERSARVLLNGSAAERRRFADAARRAACRVVLQPDLDGLLADLERAA